MTEESLFAAALGKSNAAERAAFLDAACAGDAALRERVKHLLAADARTRGILDHSPGPADLLAACGPEPPPAMAVPRAAPEADPPGYELFEAVGEGGMGVVYRARDARLARDVAVKLLHPRFAVGGPAAIRFLGEARITAQLQHPGVPPIHEVGSFPDGRPFLVMKLIRGRTLAELLPEAVADRGRLLSAFEQVCQAVAFAHDRGVVHRDLKPSNVMVGSFGEVQVMDWGLAKVLAPAAGAVEPTACDEATVTVDASAIDSDRGAGDATRAGSVLGTPAYMPPEQAIGAVDQIDQRSDVFGLGAILCAILTGQPPYLGADSESTRQLAARARLGDAYLRLDACGADPGLVELCRRCLAPEQPDRPADAGEVARVVAGLRAAADERARAAELDRVRVEGERARAEAEAREQRKRRRVQLALAAAVGLLLAAGGAFAWWQDHRQARNAEAVAALLDQCENALRADRTDQAAVALEVAEGRAADGGADGLKERLVRLRADLELVGTLNDIDTSRWTWTDRGFPPPEAVVVRMRSALAAYGIAPDEHRAEGAAARVNGSLVRGRLVTVLDLWLAHEPSAWVREVLRTCDPDDPFRDAVRDALASGDRPRAVALAGRPDALAQPPGFAIMLAQLGGLSMDRQVTVLESALRNRPGNLALLMALGNTYPQTRREFVAERVRWFQAAVAAHPGSAVAHNSLAVALRDKGDRDGARAEVREAVRLDPKYAPARNNLGLVLRGEGNLDGAIGEFLEAIRLDPKLAVAHSNLGLLLQGKGDCEGALTAYREALRADSNYAGGHNNLAWLLAVGPDGVRDGKQAVVHATRACELSNWARPECLDTLAAACAAAGDFDRAVEYQNKALSFPDFEKADGPGGRHRLQLYAQKKPYRGSAWVLREVAPPPRGVKP